MAGGLALKSGTDAETASPTVKVNLLSYTSTSGTRLADSTILHCCWLDSTSLSYRWPVYTSKTLLFTKRRQAKCSQFLPIIHVVSKRPVRKHVVVSNPSPLPVMALYLHSLSEGQSAFHTCLPYESFLSSSSALLLSSWLSTAADQSTREKNSVSMHQHALLEHGEKGKKSKYHQEVGMCLSTCIDHWLIWPPDMFLFQPPEPQS